VIPVGKRLKAEGAQGHSIRIQTAADAAAALMLK
jgi:hypothetical protein